MSTRHTYIYMVNRVMGAKNFYCAHNISWYNVKNNSNNFVQKKHVLNMSLWELEYADFFYSFARKLPFGKRNQ